MAKIYVSHNHDDRDLVSQVVGDLLERKHELQIDTTLLGEGGDWQSIMRDQIQSADTFVVFVSRASLQSDFVLAETGAARFRRETDGMLMIPVILDGVDRPRILEGVKAIRGPREEPRTIASKIQELIDQSVSGPGIDLFISHAHRDVDVAASLVTALEVGLDVPPSSIRCTSVPGYKLDLGAMPDEQLARELNATKCVLAIVTPYSLASQWVLFELGATWALAKAWIPLLAQGIRADDLPGPLRGAAAASLSDEHGLRAARDQIAKKLQWAPGNTPASDRLIAETAALAKAKSFFEDDVKKELGASFAAKRASLGATQGKLVDHLANGPGARERTLEELATAFPMIDRTTLYYRLEQLRYLGFVTRRGVSPDYRWCRSSEYGAELGIV